MIGYWFDWFSEGALRWHTLLPPRLAPLPGSLTRSGAQRTVSLGHSVLRLYCCGRRICHPIALTSIAESLNARHWPKLLKL